MAYPLSYYSDNSHTRALMGAYGDRLQNLDRSDFLDVITIFSAACNTDLDSPHSEDDLAGFMEAMEMVCSVHVDSILEIMDGFERSNELSLLLGLAAMLADRSAE